MRQKSITAACCMLGLICALFAVCAVQNDEATTSGAMPAYEAAENVFPEEDTAVLETQEVRALTADEERYQQYIDQLDAALADSQSRQQGSSFYRANVSAIYTFKEGMSGWLLAVHDEQGIFLVDWLMEDDTREKGTLHRYRFFQFEDGSWYFTYQTNGQGIEEDIPDYLVNEDTLRYHRIDYVYDDGSDLEEKRRNKEKVWQEGFDRTISGEILEFWCMEGTLYAVDRQEGTLTDASRTKAACISAFLQMQQDCIAAELNIDEAKAAQAEELIPDGYCLLLDSWKSHMAAYDLNKDGSMDYVMVLYPEDYPEEKRYEDFSPYEHIPEYYASAFWLLLSDSEQGYLPIQLTDKIEYLPLDDALTLTEISFVGDGILQLEYFVGRSPFCTAVLNFAPRIDQDKGEYFYLQRSYFRDDFYKSIQIGDEKSYGECGIRRYFQGDIHYDEYVWVHTTETPLEDGNILGYYSSSQYQCEDSLEEDMINSQIKQRENDILDAAQRNFACQNFKLDIDPIFWNSRIICYKAVFEERGGTRLAGEMEEEPDFWRVTIPIMVDRETGENVAVTDFIEKEEFLELFEHYAYKTEWGYDESLTGTEKEQCIAILEEGWETADSLDSLTAFDGKEISLRITQQGIIAGLRTEDGAVRLTDYRIDKEHFMGTGLWYYLAPEWMQ